MLLHAFTERAQLFEMEVHPNRNDATEAGNKENPDGCARLFANVAAPLCEIIEQPKKLIKVRLECDCEAKFHLRRRC